MKKYNQTGFRFTGRRKKHLLIFALYLSVMALAFLGALHVNQVCAQQTLWDFQQGKDEIGQAFGTSGSNPKDIRLIVANIIKVFLTFVGIIMIIMIIFAGVKWMTAGGNQDRVSQARQTIKNAVIGIIIILASYAITDWLADCVFDVQSTASTVWMCH